MSMYRDRRKEQRAWPALHSAAHLYISPDAMDLAFEAFDFADELRDRPNEALIDIGLRKLVLRVLKESLGR